MKPTILACAIPVVAMLAGCSTSSPLGAKATAAAATVPGQLFCTFVTGNGAQFVQAVNAQIDAAAATAGGPLAGVGAVIVTNQTDAFVQGACAAAAKAVGAVAAVPTSPPPALGADALAPVTIPAAAVAALLKPAH